ncbi:MAG: ABC transporter substrate-binding protein [Propioniciclava sp.]|uniref:ABC transporter substrate-binding protein n=1 Tax=Propioniciclava sp. TaxID=2038686 RepID=UPI0039E352B7
MTTFTRRGKLVAVAASLAVLATGCSANTAPAGSPSASATAGTVTVTNCGVQQTYPSPATRIHANDGGIIAMLLAIGAQDSISSVSSLQRDRAVLTEHYGNVLGSLQDKADGMPSLETLIAATPQIVFAGWNYGFKEGAVTPDQLHDKGIASYLLTESCRKTEGEVQRGIMAPWDALREDLGNLGKITGKTANADAVLADLGQRLAALTAAPQANPVPRVLLFDSGSKNVFTSGNKGAPQAIIEAAGAANVMGDVDDTWTSVSWERVAGANPDAIVFVDYGTQTFAEKVALLESNPATKDLDAVKQKRYLNLPYAMWVSSPLNIDAAEQLRARLEQWKLVPDSELPAPKFDDHLAESAS